MADGLGKTAFGDHLSPNGLDNKMYIKRRGLRIKCNQCQGHNVANGKSRVTRNFVNVGRELKKNKPA